MAGYKRTELGDQELLQRKLRLSSRARTLLLLLESEDLKQPTGNTFEKIANPQNYQILLDLNLIVDQSVDSTRQPINAEIIPTVQHTIVQTTSSTPVQNISDTTIVDHQSASQTTIQASEPVSTAENLSVIEASTPLSFVEIKLLMQHTLKQYCGLMAKNLVNAIEQSSSTYEIRQYQSKWLTSLFETRISRQQLNELLRVINHSMDKIEIAKQS